MKHDAPADTHPPTPWRRIGWFVLLWVGGVAAVSAAAYALRAVMTLVLA